MAKIPEIRPYRGAAAGWHALSALRELFSREGALFKSLRLLRRQNKPGGFACVSCAWAKPAKPHPVEVCEHGAKATAWEVTSKRVGPDFFLQHTVRDLEKWPDHNLEELGRLTHPLKWDAASDTYREIAWSTAFAEIGSQLKPLEPNSVVFYLSGHAALETAYMWQLFARLFGTNNLPNSSNMCHESTSVALPKSIGVPVGTVFLEDFDKADCILSFGQNATTNSPRILTPFQRASRRGVPIITFNPIREPGLVAFRNPQSLQMATGASTRISSRYHQVKVGGDMAVMIGICKALLTADDDARSCGQPRVLDPKFIAVHTHGFDTFAEAIRGFSWSELEQHSGLSREVMVETAEIYGCAKATIACYGMGLTQHRTGVENVQMLANLLLLRGNIGKPGAGICPVRGHSNIQGQRTVSVGEKPELVPLDKLAAQFGFEPPRTKGFNTVEACEAILSGNVNAFLSFGGNFVRATPERNLMEKAWRNIPLTVYVATKLNHGHLVHGKASYILPCLGRIEVDRQASGRQWVTVEDATARIHASRGFAKPASRQLLSEPKIVAELAKATLSPNPRVVWNAWVANYARIREAIAETYPEIFRDFNTRMHTPGGFPRPLGARERKWNTETGRANFIVPSGLKEDEHAGRDDILQLITLRSNDQFNTSIYSHDDRYRGVFGSRDVVLMNAKDLTRLRLRDGDTVHLISAEQDNVQRIVPRLRATAFDIPEGCCAGYFPDCNPLIAVENYAAESKTPAAKSIPVQVVKSGVRDRSRTAPAEALVAR